MRAVLRLGARKSPRPEATQADSSLQAAAPGKRSFFRKRSAADKPKQKSARAPRPAAPLILPPYTRRPSRNYQLATRWVVGTMMTFALLYGAAFALFAPYLIIPFAVPLAILGAFAIWALPETGRAPTRSMTALFYIFLVALIAWPNYLAIALPGLPWITFVRLTSAPMVILLLVSIPLSKPLREQLAGSLNASPLIWRLLAGFVVIQILTLPLSHHLGGSLNRLVNAMTTWTAMFVVSCYVFLKPKNVERWVGLLCILVVPIGLIAIGEHFKGRVLWAGHIPKIFKIEDPSVANILAGNMRHYTNIIRSQSTFTTPLGLGEYLALTTPFVLHFATGDFRRLTRWSAVVLLPFIALIVFLAHSRVGSVGLFAGLLLYTLIWALRGRLLNPNSTFYSLLIYSYPATFVALLAGSLFIGRLKRLVWGGGETTMSNLGRAEQLRMAKPILLKNPIGHGVGEAATVLNFHEPGGLLTIDSYFLSILLEYGVVGFLLYYGFFGWAAFRAGLPVIRDKTLRGETTFLMPLAVSLVVFILSKTVYSEEANHPLAFIFVGMTCALLYRIRRSSHAAVPEQVQTTAVRSNMAASRRNLYMLNTE